jgi:hypothetical protein
MGIGQADGRNRSGFVCVRLGEQGAAAAKRDRASAVGPLRAVPAAVALRLSSESAPAPHASSRANVRGRCSFE